LKLKKSYVRVLEHLSTPCFTSFEMSSQIVQLTSAFVYLRYEESYYSDIIILEATTLLHHDAIISLVSIITTIYLFLSLLITASNKEWWGLHHKLKLKRTWYAKRHR